MSCPPKIRFGLVSALGLFVVALTFARWVEVRNASRIAETQLYLTVFQLASANYFKIVGEWPECLDSLKQNASNIAFVSWSTPTNDGWGRPIIFEPYHAERGYGRLLSYGRDGQPGGQGPDADIERRFGP